MINWLILQFFLRIRFLQNLNTIYSFLFGLFIWMFNLSIIVSIHSVNYVYLTQTNICNWEWNDLHGNTAVRDTIKCPLVVNVLNLDQIFLSRIHIMVWLVWNYYSAYSLCSTHYL